MICQVFANRAYAQPDGVLRVMEREDLPEGCPPFVRVFTVHGVPAGQRRGDHAHRRCHQVFVMLRGSCTLQVEAPDGATHTQELTGIQNHAVWVPPWRWCRLTHWSHDATLMVLASVPYDPGEYIHDYDEFRAGPEVGP